MKTKKLDKSLELNKTTIANLNYDEMRIIYGRVQGLTKDATDCNCSKTILTSCCK